MNARTHLNTYFAGKLKLQFTKNKLQIYKTQTWTEKLQILCPCGYAKNEDRSQHKHNQRHTLEVHANLTTELVLHVEDARFKRRATAVPN